VSYVVAVPEWVAPAATYMARIGSILRGECGGADLDEPGSQRGRARGLGGRSLPCLPTMGRSIRRSVGAPLMGSS
jgi:hypothetical protein